MKLYEIYKRVTIIWSCGRLHKEIIPHIMSDRPCRHLIPPRNHKIQDSTDHFVNFVNFISHPVQNFSFLSKNELFELFHYFDEIDHEEVDLQGSLLL